MHNKIVLITGASRGIGEACATAFAKSGAKLLLCARRHDKLVTHAAALIKRYNVAVYTFELDISRSQSVDATLKALPIEWQAVDILINNAGLAKGLESIQEGQILDWEAMIDTNVKGLLYMTRAILPSMLSRNTGHIINIGSIAGHDVYPNGVVYCATKAAVKTLTKGLKMDLFGTPIRVTTVDPGAVETNFSNVRFKGDTERVAKVYAGMQPLTPQDIAESVLYCATRAPHINISELIIMPTAQASVGMIARDEKVQ